MARTTPGTGIPVPESPDPRTITADLWASFSKVGQLITQTSGESSAALVTAEQAKTAAAQALARALLIEDPIHVGPSEPTNGEELWVDTDDDSSGGTGGEVTAADITDASTVGRAVLTAPLSVDARNALSIFTGTRALLDAGTDTAERTWDAKELHEYVTDTAAATGGAASWDDLTGKPTVFPPSAHMHPVSDVNGLADRLAALEYDSGVVDIAPLIRPGYTVGAATIHRVSRTVTLSFEGLVPDADGSGFPFNNSALVEGLRPPGERPFQAVATSGAACRMAVRPGYGVGIYGATAGVVYVGTVTYLVPPALPSALPGS